MIVIGIKTIRIADKLLNGVIAFVCLVVLLYSILGLWDSYSVYKSAGNSDIIFSYKPKGKNDTQSLKGLQEINPDVCGWLTIKDTSIDYPLVQGKTNMEYINKDVEGNFSLSGSIFLDYRNNTNFDDSYSIVYGHHMEGGRMFGNLASFLKEDYFNQHQIGTLYQMDSSKTIQIFAVVESDAFDSILFHPIKEDRFSKETLLKRIDEKAIHRRTIPINDGDDIIGLSTCYNTNTNGRILVFGKLVEN